LNINKLYYTNGDSSKYVERKHAVHELGQLTSAEHKKRIFNKNKN